MGFSRLRHRYLKVRVNSHSSQMATNGHSVLILFRRVVVQIRPEPSLDLSYAHPFTFVIVGDLIAVDLAEAEVSRFGMS